MTYGSCLLTNRFHIWAGIKFGKRAITRSSKVFQTVPSSISSTPTMSIQLIGLGRGETDYGLRFPSVSSRNNVMATQFHPEKSGRWGLKLPVQLRSGGG